MKNVPRIEKMPILGLICSRQSAVTGSMSSSRCSQHRAGGYCLPGKGGLGPLGAPRFHLYLLSLLLIGSLAQCNAAHRPKNVNVALQAKWTSTPLLLEAGELLAKNRDDLYWTFVEQWNTREFSDSMSDRDCFERILAIGSSLLNGPTEPIFHLSLLLRSASPKLVLYHQLAQESLFRYQMLEQGSYSNEGITPGASLTMDIQSKDLDRWSISRNPSAAEGRCCWVDVGTYFFVEVSELSTWLKTLEQKAEDLEEIELFDFDHIYPGSASTNIVAILYGAVGTPCFWKFHSVLAQASKQGNIRYAFRPVLPTGCEEAANKCALVGFGTVLHLGGYGVELALKNMEYKAIDDSDVKKGDTLDESRTDDLSQEVKGFIFSKLLERKPELTGELMTFRDHLFSAGLSDTMNVWELKDLGYQTAQRIIHAAEPLQLMQEINQNFPNLVSSLSRMKLNQTMKEEIVANQRMIPPGKSLFALNGALIDIDSLDLYSLIDLVGGELSLADAIFKMKVPSRFARSLMQIPDPVEKSSIRVDFRSDHVHYLNNLEEDALYRRWRSNVNELLMPVFPGQLRYIKKNLYHAVYVIDPASPAGLKVIDTIMHYYDNNVPMRFGLILLSSKMVKSMIDHGGVLPSVGTSNEDEEDLSSLIVRLFFYIKDNYGITTAFQFLNSINEAQGGDIDGQEDEPVEVSYVEEAFFETVKARAQTPAEEILQKLEKGIDYKEEVLKSTEFVYKLGFSQMHPCLLMNGLVYGPSQVQSGALAAMNEELPRIQEGVYYGQINSKTDVLDKFLKENGHARYNPHIIVTNKEEHRYISLTEAVTGQESVLAGLHFLHSPGTEDDIKPITHLVVVDLSDREGFQLLQQAVCYLMNGSKKGRLGILFNILDVSSSVKPTHLLLYRVIKASMNFSLRSKILPFLQSLLSSSETHSLIVAEQCQSDTESLVESLMNLADEVGIKLGALRNELTDPSVTDLYVEQMSKEVVFLSTQLGLKPGSNAVVTNGKIFVQKKGEYFFAEDFLLLESVEYEQRVKPVAEIVEKVEWEVVEPDELTSEFISTVIMAISSAMAVRSRSSGTARFDLLQSEFSAIVRQADNATIHVDAVIDPLSSTGQKLSPLLLLLQHWFQPSMRIVLNPMNSLADLPLKNFYRYVVPPKDNFTPDGELMAGLVAVFSNMPPTRTLTMNLDVPEPWLVEPVRAIHDLDNIVLEKIGDVRTMYAGFELEALVLTGHCFEKNNDPPRGLQLLLGTKIQSHMVDTIVMANLGYWQLKAAPGVWTLSLAPGRSSNLYTLHGPEEGTENGPLSKKVFIKDLRGELIRLEVVKRKGLEDQKVLGSDDETDDEYFGFSTKKGKKSWNKNLLKWASGLLGSSKQAQESDDQGQLHGRIIERRGEAINIFSIASGHLYERFLKIMMLSVLRNTRRPVKFWFIKNYLSPQFKDFIPQMAMEYGFDYDLVTYKWPTWLQKQSEKQRIIWAYKILFLDVIFPLSLKKVIFVDADQIVRTDMGELYDMDLKGKPLAYTPFCDNNKEMDGYRFWNQGFWKDHLRGKPYHISALYVVDLVKFRQTAAGDTLRVFYETLSKDPGSLSNLDQDLPNYAQHTVPIFSLPQEWLWCESWCGNATKSKAKTIDLCNNPMTKEPKLEGARRIVAEWPSLDEEARRLTAKILGEDADTSPEELENEELPSSNTDSDAETAAEL